MYSCSNVKRRLTKHFKKPVFKKRKGDFYFPKVRHFTVKLRISTKQVQLNSFLEAISQCIINNYKTNPKYKYEEKLTEKDKTLMKHTYKKIIERLVLKEETTMEDVLYNKAKDYSVEHEIKEIEKETGKANLMKALPESLTIMLMNLDGKNDFDSIDKVFQDISCNRRHQPEEYWYRESVFNYLNPFMDKDSIESFPTEQDLLQDMYGFINNSSSSTSFYNKNMRRALGSIDIMEQMVTDRSDLTFRYPLT
ncbi:hypothetical protein J3Q64DRAFT_1703738 [Phycomyces blakesleeanus]|uniref:Uncharacterized protein n=2 Tax=Phycomyces blakesleeanus TaxID=4837 RepID=A0A162U5L2_PHYB8|nr:hypothetical protein PHYBLDRAFT_71831 [Phycomyces blakesleeanus NRRL 1555(-)]OAD73622.1 hypothetical protein PHYBLDRAFT_71831 [Phycomyces blakesleeanus NRRL 1555(-)]|eukprot:XP_018291662.1 hypothetical protein PHYBLDRAFT_71831 [Phycomyces blakesleeanus NRRL 1555(-)]